MNSDGAKVHKEAEMGDDEFDPKTMAYYIPLSLTNKINTMLTLAALKRDDVKHLTPTKRSSRNDSQVYIYIYI